MQLAFLKKCKDFLNLKSFCGVYVEMREQIKRVETSELSIIDKSSLQEINKR